MKLTQEEEKMVTALREVAYTLIDEAREEQIEKGKPQKHAWATWNAIVNKYFGRVSEEMLSLALGEKDTIDDFIKVYKSFMGVAMAWFEDILDYETFLNIIEEDNADKAEEAEGS